MSKTISDDPNVITDEVRAANGQAVSVKKISKYDGTVLFEMDKEGMIPLIDKIRIVDGTTYTSVQSAIDALSTPKVVFIPTSTLTSIAAISPKSGDSIIGAGTLSSILKLGATSGQVHAISLVNKSDVVLRDFQIDGQKAIQTFSNHNIYAIGSHDIRFRDIYSKDAYFDGVYLGHISVGPTYNAWLDNIHIEGAGRCGFGITSGYNIWARNIHSHGCGSNDPVAGMDIEPNDATDHAENIWIDNLYTHDNLGVGFSFLGHHDSYLTHGNLFMKNLHSYNNSGSGIALGDGHNLNFIGGVLRNNQDGFYCFSTAHLKQIRLARMNIHNNVSRGAGFITNGVIDVVNQDLSITDCAIYNNGSYGLQIEGKSNTYPVRYVTIANNRAYDDQAVPTQTYGIAAAAFVEYVNATDNITWGNKNAGVFIVGTGCVSRGNLPDNVSGSGMVPVTVGASPFTWTNDARPSAVYIAGGTVSRIERLFCGIGTSSPWSGVVPPYGQLIITYSVLPEMWYEAV